MVMRVPPSPTERLLRYALTAVSTVLAPFLTPLLTLLYAGQRVDVNPVNIPGFLLLTEAFLIRLFWWKV